MDSLKVTYDDGITGRTDSMLFAKKTTDSAASVLCNYLISFNVDSLKDEYVNPHIEDGDRKNITIKIGNKTKHVYTANYMHDQLVRIYDIVNTMLDEKYRIRYYKPTKISVEDFER
jgi:TATA-binding protein-associated factor Taf7